MHQSHPIWPKLNESIAKVIASELPEGHAQVVGLHRHSPEDVSREAITRRVIT
jgi:hypothetical protein